MSKPLWLLERLQEQDTHVIDVDLVPSDKLSPYVKTYHVTPRGCIVLNCSSEPDPTQIQNAEIAIEDYLTKTSTEEESKNYNKSKMRLELRDLIKSNEESAQLLRAFTKLLLMSLRPVYQKLNLPMRTFEELQDILSQLASQGSGEHEQAPN